jgi:molybdopterin-guanine dinucleotide biosynthesis protein B
MNRVHVIGTKNVGKTRLIVEVVNELKLRGVRVGTIKHTPHPHVLDTPGTDSYRHRAAGADPAAIVTPDTCAVFRHVSRYTAYEQLEPVFDRCEVVLVEGDRETDHPKLEVWDSTSGEAPMAASDATIAALVTDNPSAVGHVVGDHVLIVSRKNLPAIGDVVLTLARRAAQAP